MPTLQAELEAWIKKESEEYEKAKELISAINNGKLEEVDHAQIIDLFLESIFCIPGVALSYQIHLTQQFIEKNKSSSAPAEPVITKPASTTVAAERLKKYLQGKT